MTVISRLAVELGSAGELPSEFRLFVSGWNETENGRFLFDADSAAAVMAAYRDWGVDLAIDLEHQMLEQGISPDPTAKDARGWFRLELRADGSLWAVNVRWTEDGAARLRGRRQRYISPAFHVDSDSRITSIINAAITAIPATHHTPALIAARKQIARLSGGRMDSELVKQALDALESGDAAAALEILKGLIAAAAAGEAAEMPEEAPAEPPAEAPVEMSAAEEDKPEEVAAMSARLMRLSGQASIVDALADVETWRKSHLELESERQKLAKERATLEAAERRKLCVELVTLGAEFPSTVWADDHSTSLKSRWLAMPIAELRTHVAEQRSARGGKPAKKLSAPSSPASGGKVVQTSRGPVELSDSEIQTCTEVGAKLEDFAAHKAARAAQLAARGK